MDQNNEKHTDVECICPACKKNLYLEEALEKMTCPFCNHEISIGEKDIIGASNDGILENAKGDEPQATGPSTIPKKTKSISRLTKIVKRIVWPLFLLVLGVSLLCGSGVALSIMVHGPETWPPVALLSTALFALLGMTVILLLSFRHLHRVDRRRVLPIVLGGILLAGLAYGATYWKIRPKHEKSKLVEFSSLDESQKSEVDNVKVAILNGIYPGHIETARNITFDLSTNSMQVGAVKVRKMLIATWKVKDILERSPTKNDETGDFDASTLADDQNGAALVLRLDGWIAIAPAPVKGPDLRRIGSGIRLKDKRSAQLFGVSGPGQYMVDDSGDLIPAVHLFGWVLTVHDVTSIAIIALVFQLFLLMLFGMILRSKLKKASETFASVQAEP